MKHIILGTAHSADIAGKRSPDNKFREYEYSRKVANGVKVGLEAKGVHVIIDIPDNNISSSQSVELAKRVSIVNNICAKYGAGNCAYVSIHCNASGADGKWHNAGGWCIYTTKGQNNSDKLATCIHEVAQEELKKSTTSEHLRDAGYRKSGSEKLAEKRIRTE